MQPTTTQQKIIDSVLLRVKEDKPQNFMISAVAGAGKTTLFSFLAKEVQSLGVDFAAITFSNALAADMRQKIDGNVSTVHAYCLKGLKEYARIKSIKSSPVRQPDGTVRRSLVNPDCAEQITKALLKKEFGITSDIPKDKVKEFYSLLFTVLEVVRTIRIQALITPESILSFFQEKYAESTVKLAMTVVNECTRYFLQRGNVDFEGMLYLPLVVEGLKKHIPSPTFLAVDEINDTYPALEENYKIISRNTKWVAFAGDNQQTIHIWAGAKHNILPTIALEWETETLSYFDSFRVPVNMCEYLNASGIDNRIKPFTDKIGKLETMSYNKMLAKIQPGEAVLCRYKTGVSVLHNLETVSIDMLRLGKRVVLHGSTYLEDIKQCLSLVDSSLEFKHALSSAVDAKVNEIINELKTTRSLTDDSFAVKEWKRKVNVFHLYHKYYCSTTFPPYTAFITFLEKLYNNEKDAIQLYSIHASKGKEWKRVYILHMEAVTMDVSNQTLALPARIEAHNLCLVALTRSTGDTFIIDGQLPSSLPRPTE